MPTKVGTKWQVVIEKDVREKLQVQPGSRTIQRVVGDKVEIAFIPPPHKKSLRGILAKHIHPRYKKETSWEKIRETTWKRVAREKYGSDRNRA